MTETRAEILLRTDDLRGDIRFFADTLGMPMDMIFPADNPQVAVFSGHGLRVRLDAHSKGGPGTILIRTDNPMGFAKGHRVLTSPGGTRVEIGELDPPLVMPPTAHAFVVRRLADQVPWIIGRAGMHYRDLIPSRLGGSIIASHIRIPDGGPVPDMVHFHKVGFQLIFCYKGWVDVVYEDQGGPIRLHAGDCFIQPPEIRHRVLAASDGIEVIEIGVPAEHVTEIDHAMTLPSSDLRPDREWQGQRFVHNVASEATWQDFRIPGYICRDTSISANTKGIASVQVIRRVQGDIPWTSHDADIQFAFIMQGEMTLDGDKKGPCHLTAGDAFVVPPGMRTRYADPTGDVELLEVMLPGECQTILA
ncbi:MAG: cupin domain-containing protein [Paracoccaceae bacterium]